MELGNQFGSAIIVAYGLEWIKRSPIPILNVFNTAKYKAFIGFLAAVLTTSGISYTFDYNVTEGGQFITQLPSLHTFWDLCVQWALQQASYDGFVRKNKE